MKKLLTIFFITLTFFACSKKKSDIPVEVLSMKDMQMLLTDIHLAQSAATIQVLSDSSIYNSKEYVNYVLKDHKVTREKFLASMKFYTENPELLEEVYDSVITELSRLQGESEAQ
jgi:hypothetical protein